MLKNIQKNAHLLIVQTCLVLSACGGGGGTPEPSKVLQESELYNPATNPTGAVEQLGQTAVLGLQANVSDLPPPSATPNQGVEDLWFEVKDSQSVQFTLASDAQAAINRVEIRDPGNVLLATVNAATPSITLTLLAQRYQALLYASAANTAPVPVFVQYAAQQVAVSQEQAATVPGRVQPQQSLPQSSKMQISNSCQVCDFSGRRFWGWSFVGINLSGANLSGSDFSGVNFSGVNISGGNLDRANLDRANLSGANLSGANLFGAFFDKTNLSGANLSGANLFGVDFSLSNVTGVNLSGVNLSATNLLKANLSGANLSGAKLAGVTLFEVNLSGANLSGANLSGADLSGVNFSGANLSGAIFSNAIWVDGRRICAAGSIGTCQ
jgi:uncharacterized protein YjbI with pentapeptide repeats